MSEQPQSSPEPITGGPTESAPPPAPAPTPPPDAEWQRERADWQRERSEWQREREDTARWRRAVEQRLPPPPQPAEPDLERIWFENPRLAAQMIAQGVEQRMEQRYEADQSARTQAEKAERFFGSVFEAHPEIRGEDHLVQLVFQRDGAELLQMKVPEAREALARKVRDEILRMEKRASEIRTAREGTTPPDPRRAVVEGGSTPQPNRQASAAAGEEAGLPRSLSAVIEARKARRAAAQDRVGRRSA